MAAVKKRHLVTLDVWGIPERLRPYNGYFIGIVLDAVCQIMVNRLGLSCHYLLF